MRQMCPYTCIYYYRWVYPSRGQTQQLGLRGRRRRVGSCKTVNALIKSSVIKSLVPDVETETRSTERITFENAAAQSFLVAGQWPDSARYKTAICYGPSVISILISVCDLQFSWRFWIQTLTTSRRRSTALLFLTRSISRRLVDEQVATRGIRFNVVWKWFCMNAGRIAIVAFPPTVHQQWTWFQLQNF